MIHTGISEAIAIYAPMNTIHAVLPIANPTFSPTTVMITIPMIPITVAGPVFMPPLLVRRP